MKYVGIPYNNLGRSFDGCDCYGLVWLYNFNEMNVKLPDYLKGYLSADDQSESSIFISVAKMQWQKQQTPEIGDAIVFRINKYPSHVGVSLGGDDFLHILRGRNSCIESLNSMAWRNSICGVYRWIN